MQNQTQGNFWSDTFDLYIEKLISKKKLIPVREHGSCDLQFSRFTQRFSDSCSYFVFQLNKFPRSPEHMVRHFITATLSVPSLHIFTGCFPWSIV